jgi:hypothetical protein
VTADPLNQAIANESANRGVRAEPGPPGRVFPSVASGYRHAPRIAPIAASDASWYAIRIQ